jgi:hypothetical protein
LNNDIVLNLLSFGVWVALLLFALIVAGWVGDRARDYHKKKRTTIDYYEYLNLVVADDREARKGHLTADEIVERSRVA